MTLNPVLGAAANGGSVRSQRLSQICFGAYTLSTIRRVRKPIPYYTDETCLILWTFTELSQYISYSAVTAVQDT